MTDATAQNDGPSDLLLIFSNISMDGPVGTLRHELIGGSSNDEDGSL